MTNPLRFAIAVVFIGVLSQPVYADREYTPITDGPFNAYLTFTSDTTRQIAVNYHTLTPGESEVRFGPAPRNNPADYPRQATGTSRTIPNLPDGRHIHGVVLDDLEPDTAYYFTVGNDRTGYSDEFAFKTLPGGGAPLRFIVGGDMGVSKEMRTLLARAAQREPHFMVVGGDIAYANGELDMARKWDLWFKNVHEHLNENAGYLVPLITAMGNHETNDFEHEPPEIYAPYYTGFFWTQHDGTYFTKTFGDYLAIVVLDSGHITPQEDQVDWLAEQLAAYGRRPATFAVYHVPMYPGHRDYDGRASRMQRELWLPIFDEYELTAGFEHHDHVHKRTHPLRNSVKNPDGTVYIGDGNFGIGSRDVPEIGYWYTAALSSTPHFWLVDVSPDRATFSAVNKNGDVFDSTTIPLDSAAPAAAE